uniref:Uncharacterized protein n=1 Tax=Amphimedon queenslandica TaxID=400682 RepID=A0A1X7VTW7_AMPQE
MYLSIAVPHWYPVSLNHIAHSLYH